MLKVSVITPIYKTEQYLEKCLLSLVAQTLEDIEFIWVDNGANDECREIIKKYETKRPNIKVIHLETNKGYGGAMNAGLDVAEGDYIGFCDSDDWVDVDYYEKLYSATHDGKFDVVYTEYQMEFEDKTVIRSHLSNKVLANLLQEKIDILRDGAIWDKLFRRRLIHDNNIRFFEHSRSYYEDNVLLMQAVLRANSIAMITGCYYHYVQHIASLMHNTSHAVEHKESLLNVISYIIDLMYSNNLSNDEKLSGLRFINRSLSLKGLLRQTSQYNTLIQKLPKDDFILSQLANLYNSLHLPWFKRIFCIQNNMLGKHFYLLGVKFKLKKGESK